jgi:membrane associated rhomboid family serine protease
LLCQISIEKLLAVFLINQMKFEAMKDNNQFQFSPSVWIIPSLLVLLIWFVFYIEKYTSLDFSSFGILPRTLSGLKGILFSPFLHGDLNHLANNSIPLFLLTLSLIYFYRNLSLKILFYGILLSGIITWLIGRNSYHIGASSLIYVLFSFIFFKGFITKYYRLMALSLMVITMYGGMIWYVFPSPATEGEQSISWEGHLAGLLVGFIFALYYKTPNYVKETYYDWQQPDFNPEEDAFMKHFDENGNFVNTPKPEEELEEITTPKGFNYVYIFKEKDKEE